MRDVRALLVVSAAIAAVCSGSFQAEAKTVCKSTASTAVATYAGAAPAAWSKAVTRQYGSAWANFNLARDKQWSEGLLGITFLSAYPCHS
jgi:hypothetical protein